MENMDVRINDTIVCYDMMGMLTAPRVSWMLRAYGAKNVHVLNGSYSKWLQQNLPVEKGQKENEALSRKGIRKTEASECDYKFTLNPNYLRTYEQMTDVV